MAKQRQKEGDANTSFWDMASEPSVQSSPSKKMTAVTETKPSSNGKKDRGTNKRDKDKKIQSKQKRMEELMFLRAKLEKAREDVQVRKSRLHDHLEAGKKDGKKKKKKSKSRGSKSVCSVQTEDGSKMGGSISIKSERRKVRTGNPIKRSQPPEPEQETWTNPFASINGIGEGVDHSVSPKKTTKHFDSTEMSVEGKFRTASKASLETVTETTGTMSKATKKGVRVVKRTKKSSDAACMEPSKDASCHSFDPMMLSAVITSSREAPKTPVESKKQSKQTVTVAAEITENGSMRSLSLDSINVADESPASPLTPTDTRRNKKKKVRKIPKGTASNPEALKAIEDGNFQYESQSSLFQSANSSFSTVPSPVTPLETKRKQKKAFRVVPAPGLIIEDETSSCGNVSLSSKLSVASSSVRTPPYQSASSGRIRNTPTSIQSKRALFEKLFQKTEEGPLPSIATPAGRRRRGLPEILSPPQKLKGGFVDLNLATPTSVKKKKAPAPKRIFDVGVHKENRAKGYIDSALNILLDESKEQEVCDLVQQIDKAGGFPMTKRLSMRDNELVCQMVMAIRNDPGITSIEVSPEAFGTISSMLLSQFIDALRFNLHVKKMVFSGVELGNDFLYNLATSMESNFVIEEIDLSRNLFTSAGLAEFCQAVATSNETCRKLNLENQTTPISVASEEDVLDAFRQNKALAVVQLDFQTEEGADELRGIIERNRLNRPPEVDTDKKFLSVLRYEAERAQEMWVERLEEQSTRHVSDEDWDSLYELSVLFDKRKLNKVVQQAAEDSFVPAAQRRNADGMSKAEKRDFLFGAFKKNMEESVACFNSDGSFLTPEFISKYFDEDKEDESLTFDFHGQWKLFKRFPVHDPDRALIVTKFVEALVSHPRSHEITGINMANTGCGDDFLIALADRCLEDDSALPNLFMINFETNFINEPGIVALSTMIASPTCFRFLQVVRLENQKGLLKSKAEFLLAKAMRVNLSIVVMSLRIRNLMERQQINKYVVRNVEYIRQARQRHFKATGQQRERNQIEKVFDKVADNDASITEVTMVGNKRFLTLTAEEKLKAAQSFKGNKHVKSLNLNGCCIDDDFATTLATSLKRNKVLQKIYLEGNKISGDGITALFQALAENRSVQELRLHKQSKLIPTSDEHALADILEPNKTIIKLGIDLRTQSAQVQVDRKLKLNRNLLLKERAESMGEDFAPGEMHAVVKF